MGRVLHERRRKVYGRFGGRDGADADVNLTLPGLKIAMREALAAHRKAPNAVPERLTKAVTRPEDYPAAGRLKSGACIHCHNVYDFDRDALFTAGQWKKELVWVYPPPRNIGLTLETDQQNRVKAVLPGSTAARAGLQPADVLETLGGRPVASFADAQYALHLAPASGSLPVTWERAGKLRSATLTLAPGWRAGDLTWRESMWGVPPTASVYGKDLTAEEKTALGLDPKALAFRQGDFVPAPAARAGIKARDIILGLDGHSLEMTMLQFNVFIRLNFNVGDQVTYRVLRGGQAMRFPITLARRDF